MPEHVFEQEYLAEFVDESGGVFEDVREQAEDYELPVDPEDAADPYAIGVDFARMSDWTVGIVLDAVGRVVAIERLQQTSWSRIQDVVERLADTYSPNTVALDASRDNKIVADLQDAGIGVEPVKFTASRKRTLIENLITRLETGDLVLPSGANVLINELEVFEHDMNDRGTVRYSAPSGFHDDCVDALALAAEGLEQGGGSVPSGTVDIGDSAANNETSEEFRDSELGEAVFGALDRQRGRRSD
jgi:phage terminase large subunit-like protein